VTAGLDDVRRLSNRQRDGHRRQHQLEHRARVVREALVARPRVARGHPGAHYDPAAERERRVRAVERGDAAVAEGAARPEDARARAADGRVPTEIGEPVMDGAGRRYRLALAAVRRAGGQVPREQALLAQVAHDARVPPGQRAARRLHVTEPGAGSGCVGARGSLREGPRQRRELAVQAEDADGAAQRHRELLAFDRQHRVLQRCVVELHHVRARGPRAVETARQVDVHDVEAARAQREIQRLGVYDDVVPDFGGADEPHVCDRRPACAGDLDRQPLLGPVAGLRLDHRA
jgi:hypothetical protein